MTEDDQIRYLDRKIEYLTENYLDPQAGIYIMQFLGHFSIYYNGLLYKNLCSGSIYGFFAQAYFSETFLINIDCPRGGGG